MASSWGGAVATLALARGEWQGPTVLIAPAYNAALSRSGVYDESYAPDRIYAAIAERLASLLGRVLIVHGTEDKTVPIADSRAMAAATGIELVEIQGGDHGMRVLLEGNPPSLQTLIARVSSTL